MSDKEKRVVGCVVAMALGAFLCWVGADYTWNAIPVPLIGVIVIGCGIGGLVFRKNTT